MQDVKELIGIIMRVLDRAEIDEAEVLDLDFEAEGELKTALNEAYIKLLEFAHDRGLRHANHDWIQRNARFCRAISIGSSGYAMRLRTDSCCR